LLPSFIHKIYTSSEGVKYEDNCYISFSGGKDSTVLLHLARQIYPNIPAVYIDTGLEFPEVREFALSQANIIKLVPKMNFKQVIEAYGYPVVSKEQAAFIQEYRDTKSEKLKDIRWNGNKYGRGKISKKYRYLVNAPFKISDKCCDILKN
jgi:PP-loop superfamily ATP-utilizing enzyme